MGLQLLLGRKITLVKDLIANVRGKCSPFLNNPLFQLFFPGFKLKAKFNWGIENLA